MKYLLLIFSLLFVSTGSNPNERTDQRLANSFVKDWLDSNGSKECALKYLEIDNFYLKSKEKKEFVLEWFSEFGRFLKGEIDKNEGKYQILAHKGNEENESIKKFDLKTDDYSGVYYLVSGNEVLNSIIIKNGKIISYCPVMKQGSSINQPWFINQPG